MAASSEYTWTAHKSADGRTFYYDRATATSTWKKPSDFDVRSTRHVRPDLQRCMNESPAVAHSSTPFSSTAQMRFANIESSRARRIVHRRPRRLLLRIQAHLHLPSQPRWLQGSGL